MTDSNPPRTLTQLLKEALLRSGMSPFRIERETGVKRQSVMKFLSGERTLRLDTAEKLAAYFGLTVVPSEQAKVTYDPSSGARRLAESDSSINLQGPTTQAQRPRPEA